MLFHMCISLCYILDATSIPNNHSSTAVKLRFLNGNLQRINFGMKFMDNAAHFRVKNPMSNDITSISEGGLETVKFYQFLLGVLRGLGARFQEQLNSTSTIDSDKEGIDRYLR